VSQGYDARGHENEPALVMDAIRTIVSHQACRQTGWARDGAGFIEVV